jgi:Domain of unknown function (DUF222)
VLSGRIEHMFESSADHRPGRTRGPAVRVLVEAMAGLAMLEPAADDAGLIEQIAWLERLAGAVAGVQVQLMTVFADSQAATRKGQAFEQRSAAVGVKEQLAMARNVSPSQAARDLALGKALRDRFPHVGQRLRGGETSVFTARVVVEETRPVSDRAARGIDRQYAGELTAMSPTRAGRAARFLGMQADPAGYVEAARRAPEQRRVSTRPAPDTMIWLSALLPVSTGVGAYASLDRDARAAVAAGDGRTIDQLRADLLVQRITGRPHTQPTPVQLQVTMDAKTLFGDDATPAVVGGYGAVPAGWALDLLARTMDAGTHVYLRRIVTDPVDASVVAIDTHRRLFTGPARRFLDARDQTCRMPTCDAPIRHHDHITRHTDGGPTTVTNGQGTCIAWNHVKDTPGWTIRALPPDRPNTPPPIHVITPTGHTYTSRPPPALGPGSTPPHPLDHWTLHRLSLAAPT